MTGGTSLYLAALWWQSAPAGCMGEDLDEVCAAFRALSDKTELMLLMRLSEGPQLLPAAGGGKRQQHRQHVPQSGCPDPARLLEAGAGAVPDVLYHGHRRHRPIFR